MNCKKIWGQAASALLMLSLALTPGRAQQDYAVTVDTSTLVGQTGNLILQFNPGGLDALAATAAITNFVTDGTLDPVAHAAGGGSGAFSGPAASIDNSAQLNYIFQGITFGTQITFETSFDGAALHPTAPYPSSGSTFAVSLYDTNFTTPLLTTNPDGSMLHLDVNPNGIMDAKAFTAPGGQFDATATKLASAAAPESGSLVSLLIGVALLGVRVRRRKYGIAV